MKTILAAMAAILMGAATTQAAERWHDRSDAVVIESRDYGRDHRDGYRRHNDRRRDFDGVIPEHRVVRMLSRQGFVSVEDIRLRRDRYIVEAVRPNGALVRLSIDAYDGDILSRDRIGWTRDRGRYGPDRGGRDGVEFDLGGAAIGIYRH